MLGGAVIYLVVGLDQNTLAPWHENVGAVDAASAKRIALARAETQGISLVVAGVIGPYSSLVADPPDASAEPALRYERRRRLAAG
jgi:hypothetical protein